MAIANTVFLILGIIALLDAAFALVFTKASKDMIKTFAKYLSKEKNIKKVALYELVIAIVLLIIALYI